MDNNYILMNKDQKKPINRKKILSNKSLFGYKIIWFSFILENNNKKLVYNFAKAQKVLIYIIQIIIIKKNI